MKSEAIVSCCLRIDRSTETGRSVLIRYIDIRVTFVLNSSVYAKHNLAPLAANAPRISTYKSARLQHSCNQHFQDLPELLILLTLISIRINTSKFSQIPRIPFIPIHLNSTRINTSGAKDLKSPRINTSEHKDLKSNHFNTSKKGVGGCLHALFRPPIRAHAPHAPTVLLFFVRATSFILLRRSSHHEVVL
jgi:hypothetical protein